MACDPVVIIPSLGCCTQTLRYINMIINSRSLMIRRWWTPNVPISFFSNYYSAVTGVYTFDNGSSATFSWARPSLLSLGSQSETQMVLTLNGSVPNVLWSAEPVFNLVVPTYTETTKTGRANFALVGGGVVPASFVITLSNPGTHATQAADSFFGPQVIDGSNTHFLDLFNPNVGATEHDIILDYNDQSGFINPRRWPGGTSFPSRDTKPRIQVSYNLIGWTNQGWPEGNQLTTWAMQRSRLKINALFPHCKMFGTPGFPQLVTNQCANSDPGGNIVLDVPYQYATPGQFGLDYRADMHPAPSGFTDAEWGNVTRGFCCNPFS